jgi:hypothetical protein
LIGEEGLNHAILTRVIRDDGHNSLDADGVKRGVQTVDELFFFSVHDDAQRLEDSGRDVTATTRRHRHGPLHRFAELTGRLGLAINHGLSDRSGESTFTVVAQESSELVKVYV